MGWLGMRDLLRRLFRRKKKAEPLEYMDTDSVHFLDTEPAGFTQERLREITRRAKDKTGETIEQYRARKRHEAGPNTLAGTKAIHQDVGRFMQSKGHLPGYRKSTMTKIKPEEEEE